MIDARSISLSFGERDLFQDISFQLGDRDKMCLAGRNGSGKTTLLGVLAGEIAPDSGDVIRSKGQRIGYLRQQMPVPDTGTVFEAAYEAFSEARRFFEESQELETALSSLGEGDDGMATLERLGHLHEELLRLDFYSAESETRRVLDGLGFPVADQDRPIAEFSGGWRMRVALAKILLEKPDCLFLDEPTNHLDLEAIVWLEDYLKRYSGSFVLISHDRRFVDGVCQRMGEVDRGRFSEYPLPYSAFIEAKELRKVQVIQEHKKQQDRIENLERFIDRFGAKASKASQARSKQKELDRIDKIELPQDASTMRLRFPPAPPSSRTVYQTEDLAKSYGDHQVFSGASLSLQSDDKVVLVGPNGAGKTTFAKVLLSATPATAGSVSRGNNVLEGYFAQYEEPTEEELGMTLVSFLQRDCPQATMTEIRTVLGSMLFSHDDALKQYGVLSGGERARVRLCRLLIKRCNCLIMDEPTNHLDMESKDLLMRALSEFQGAVIFVSHDRHFAAGLATRVLEVGGGRVRDYPGTYSDYLAELTGRGSLVPSAPGASASGGKNSGNSGKGQSNKNIKSQAAPKTAAPEENSGIRGGESATGVGGSYGGNNRTGSPSQAAVAVEAPALDYTQRKELTRLKRQTETRLQRTEEKILETETRLAALNEELCRSDVLADPNLMREKAFAHSECERQLGELYATLEALEAELKGMG